ncbi:unnamed protein product [Sphagnum jensenii]
MQWPEVQQLCMLEVLTDEEGDSPDEDPEATGDGGILHSESSKGKHNDCRGGTKYYNKEQQMELVLAAQGMMHDDAHQDSNVRSEEASAVDANQTYIWEDVMCMGWLKEGSVPDEVSPQEKRRIRKRAKQYCWKEGKLYFKANTSCWDDQLAKVLFGYRCGVQASTKLSPYMILTSRSPRLRADNRLDTLTDVIDDSSSVENAAEQFLEKVKLIASIHKDVLLNVGQAQKKTEGHVREPSRQASV